MKVKVKYYFLIASILLINSTLKGQSKNEIYYRVVAVSKSNPEIQAVSNSARTILPMNIKLPTAFSPNGDGMNDTFGVLSEGIENFQLTIYNRWGEVVFQSENPQSRWDGTFRGKKAPTGVYGVELIAKNADHQSIIKKSTVTLVN